MIRWSNKGPGIAKGLSSGQPTYYLCSSKIWKSPNFTVVNCKAVCNFAFVVIRFECAANFVVDSCKEDCNFTSIRMRFDRAPNLEVDDCKVVCNFTFVIIRFESAPNFVLGNCEDVFNFTLVIMSFENAPNFSWWLQSCLQSNPSYPIVTLGLGWQNQVKFNGF